jgi:hypothetical protein
MNASAVVDLYERAYNEAYAEVSRTTDPSNETFDALLLAAYERILQEELVEP